MTIGITFRRRACYRIVGPVEHSQWHRKPPLVLPLTTNGDTIVQSVTVTFQIISAFAEYCGCRDIDPRVTLAPTKLGLFNDAFMEFCEAEDEDPQEAWQILSAQDWSEWDDPQGMPAGQLKEFNRRMSQIVGEAGIEQTCDVLCAVMGRRS